MLQRFSTRRVIGFLLLDWVGTLIVLSLATLLRSEMGALPSPAISILRFLEIPLGWNFDVILKPSALLSSQVYVVVSIIWPFFFIVFSVYDGRRNPTLQAELLNVFFAICASSMALAGSLFLTYRDTPRILFLTFFVLDVALLLGARVILWIWRKKGSSKLPSRRRSVIVIGAGLIGQKGVEELRRYAWANINLIGFVDDDPAKEGQSFSGLPVLGTVKELTELVSKRNVQDAIVALPLRAHEQLVGVCRQLQQLSVHVYVIPDLFALSFPTSTLDGFGGIPVIDLGLPGIYGWRRLFKRVFDSLAVTIGLIILSPLLVAIAIAIKLDSPGPILYRQQRIGENGRLFTMLKFRSMRDGSDDGLHKEHVSRLIKENTRLELSEESRIRSLKMNDDPRVTRVGAFIRKTSLDELPQLINVLRGQMSLVGPRPPIPYEADLYQDWHKRRFEAIPGITGLWQVKGRNRVSFDEMVRMDLEYIQQQSLWLDIKILFQTPSAMISGHGAG